MLNPRHSEEFQPVTVALITPTIGRANLAEAVSSALAQLGPQDEWFIVGDGSQPTSRGLVERLDDPRIRYLEHSDSQSTYGNSQRNLAMGLATADYFVFLDDDDILLPGALSSIRRHGKSRVPLMFRMYSRPLGRLVWETPEIREGNVGGAMFVVPNIPGRWARWPEIDRASFSDFRFITDTLDLWPHDVMRWCADVIYLCREHGRGLAHQVQLNGL